VRVKEIRFDQVRAKGPGKREFQKAIHKREGDK
jgi:hypothetical protein